MTILVTADFVESFSQVPQRKRERKLSNVVQEVFPKEREARLCADLLAKKLEKEPDLLKTADQLFGELVEKFEAGIKAVFKEKNLIIPNELNRGIGDTLKIFKLLVIDDEFLDINDLQKRFATHLGLNLGHEEEVAEMCELDFFKEGFRLFKIYSDLVYSISISTYVNDLF